MPLVQPETIVAADSVNDFGQGDLATDDTQEMTTDTHDNSSTHQDLTSPDRSEDDATNELVAMRGSYAEGNETMKGHYARIFSALSMKEASSLYGEQLVRAASVEELKNCIDKKVWDFLDPEAYIKGVIPSKMFLTPKKKPNGDIDKIKGRIVAGGHRQDRSLFQDSDISSPTVSLTSVLAAAAVAAQQGHHVMTLDHKAAYLNARMEGPPVTMQLDSGVASLLSISPYIFP